MNITLSADAALVGEVREYARKNGTSLNQLVRDYFASLIDSIEKKKRKRLAEEYLKIVADQAGRSPEGWKFNREEIQRYYNDPRW